MNALMTLDNVTKFYRAQGRKRYILKDVDAWVPLGKSVGILGRNGVGKSTLVRMLARAEQPNKGKINWATGIEVSWPMGLSGGFIGTLSARDNIKVISRIYGRDWRTMADQVEAFAELGRYFEMPIKTYSSGMRSRFTFAFSVAMDFDCYLFDELMSVADARFRRRAEEEMQRLAGRSTFVIVSHRMRTIQTFCQCVFVLNDHKLEFFDDLNKGIQRYESL